MIKRIYNELKNHAPFTIFGAMTGILIMLIFQKLPKDISLQVFYILHPIHVFLSALVTAAIYELHTCEQISGKCIQGKCNFWVLFIIGYAGSVGIATISDSIIPYLSEIMLQMPHRKAHIGFIEKWWLVNPLALLGVIVAYVKPASKFPHAGHVLLSTWASLFHIMMAMGKSIDWISGIIIFIFLFLAVWLPCCISDIAFPLLFVKKKK